MNIVHLSPSAPYNEGWGYQENLLTKYQVKAGHTVTLITLNRKHEGGEIVDTECEDYMSPDGFRVIRKASIPGIVPVIGRKIKVYDTLCMLKPDLVFHHGLVSTTIFEAIRYKKRKNPNCVIVQDNHLDYNIGYPQDCLKRIAMRIFFILINKRSIKNIDRVYGVTPWRKTYAQEFFKIPEDKTDVLIMGADDEKIDFQNKLDIRERVRKQYGIAEDEFLIVTGGKIDARKKIHHLMEAVSQKNKVKLLIFGNVIDDIKESFEELLKCTSNIIYVGWIDAEQVYDYFFAADLVLFPGQHSVLWEQACAAKVPCAFQRWPGMDHVNNGGNAVFIDDISAGTLSEFIDGITYTEKYEKMKQIAESENTDIYLYSNIAIKSLECSYLKQ